MRNAKGFSYLCQSCRSIDVLGFVLFAGVVSFSVAQLLPVSGKNVNNIAYLFIVLPTLLLMVIAPAAFFDRLKHALPLWIFLGTVFVISIVQGANGFARSTVLVFFLCAGIFNLLRIRPKALVQVYGILACVAAFSTFPVIFEWFSVFLVSHTTPRLALSGHARNPIYAGLLVVSSLSFCWFILLEHRTWLRSRIRYVLAQGITFVLCLLSVTVFQSRSALLGLLACFIIHWSQNRFLKHAAILVIVSALALWAAGLDGAIVTRGLSYRPEIWWDALTRLGQTCNVFIGCGHSDEIFLGQYKGSHSAYVGTLLRHGLIGGLSFLVFGVWFFRRSMRTKNSWFLVSLVGWGGMLTAMDGFIGGPNAWWVFFWIPTAAAIHANANPFESRGDFDKQESDVTKSQESGKSGGGRLTMTVTRDTVLSVIIPTFNYAKVIERAVCSVSLQMDETTELIVIDDGSSDNTPEVLAAISLPATVRFRHVRQENAGPASARNFGIRLSVGRFLLFLDADDELLPGAIKSVLGAISEYRNPELILGAYQAHFPSGKEKLVLPTPFFGDARERVADFLLKKRIAISHGSSVVRRDFLEQRPYPENLRQTEDIPVFAYLVAYAQPVLIKHALVRVNKHPRSLRHDADLARNAHQYLAAEVFSKLPDECLFLRQDFEAKRLLSVFRTCYQSGDCDHAKSYYRLAFSANWHRALRLKYLSRYLRILMRRLKPS